MLYVTTRNAAQSYTAHKTLLSDTAPDGGLFMPITVPKLSEQQIAALPDKSFCQTVADVLNLFFSARLDGKDVDFCIGRNCTRLVSMSHRITIAENWQNANGSFRELVSKISARLQSFAPDRREGSAWCRTAVRIAFIFGIYGQWRKLHPSSGSAVPDIVVPAQDFEIPMAVCYAQRMGLPVNKLICANSDSDILWELLQKGAVNCSAVEMDAGFERLLAVMFGQGEVNRFLAACEAKEIFSLSKDQFDTVRRALYSAVISPKRISAMIYSIYHTNGYVAGLHAAATLAAAQNYRAAAGISGDALLITEQGAACDAETVAASLGIPVSELQKISGNK